MCAAGDKATHPRERHAVVIGAGFGGLAAACELVKAGLRVTVLEKEDYLGGLAGSFDFHGVALERFYHHWFTHDAHVMGLIEELGLGGDVIRRATRTGVYHAGRCYRLSSPLDLLRFKPLRWLDRIRLGLTALRARKVKDWRALESMTAADWLQSVGGRNAYRVVWEPLLRGKFGPYAPEVSAVWFWNKLVLRGGSRGKGGKEVLAYLRGGFANLLDKAADFVRTRGEIRTGARVDSLVVSEGAVTGVQVGGSRIPADVVIATPPLPVIADLVAPHAPEEYVRALRQVRFLANICLIIELDRPLSEFYWINVADPSFPYVGIIEQTNFQPPELYGGRHIVYLSKYLLEDDPLYRMKDAEVLDYSMPHLRRLFPQMEPSSLRGYRVFRAPHAQHLVTPGYAGMIPAARSPIAGLYLCTMAQIYPEDRGTNYAVREGRAVARKIVGEMDKPRP